MAPDATHTIADLFEYTATRSPDRVFVRQKFDGEWRDTTYAEVAAIVGEIALGLIDLGIAPGERVCLLSQTRPEWTYCDFAITSIGAVVVPIYATNSPEECEWVVSDSGAVAIVCENDAQAAKIAAVRANLPALRDVVIIDPGLGELRARGAGQPVAALQERSRAVTPQDPFTIIYTSGTTGMPKGCVLTHDNYRFVLDACTEIDVLRADDVAYLFLPLAHAFALLIQLLSVRVGATIAYFGGDPAKILPELQEVRPTYFPSVPRIFEKIYTAALSSKPPEVREQMTQAAQLGARVRDMHLRGETVPREIQQQFDQADAAIFAPVRAIFGGNVRQAVSGAAPISPEILEFFYGCGVPLLEGFGMTETATVATYSTIEHHRFGSVGRPIPGCEVRTADDGELLIKGRNIFQGYHGNDDASFGAIVDGWLHTGDVGRVDEDGFVYITGRKKDIIITAGGKNLTPANLENDMKQSRWVSQAVMHGDRRPYPVMAVTLDADEIVPWATEQGIADTSIAALAAEPRVRELIQAELDRSNAKYAQVEQVKRFAILDHDLSQETGELTPTLKVRRNVVNEKYATVFDSLYE